MQMLMFLQPLNVHGMNGPSAGKMDVRSRYIELRDRLLNMNGYKAMRWAIDVGARFRALGYDARFQLPFVRRRNYIHCLFSLFKSCNLTLTPAAAWPPGRIEGEGLGGPVPVRRRRSLSMGPESEWTVRCRNFR